MLMECLNHGDHRRYHNDEREYLETGFEMMLSTATVLRITYLTEAPNFIA